MFVGGDEVLHLGWAVGGALWVEGVGGFFSRGKRREGRYGVVCAEVEAGDVHAGELAASFAWC